MTELGGRALVTGAAQGIGRAIAERLAADGYDVMLADLQEKPVEVAAAEIRAAGGRASACVLDIRDRPAVASLMQGLGPLEVLVNNAAIFSDKSFTALVEQDFRDMYQTNLVGTFIVAQEAARVMADGGRIVNIGSRSHLGGHNHAHYIASKAAVAALTRAMAIDLGHRDIRVNCVAPGVIDTRLYRDLPLDRKKQMLSMQVTGRIGQPDDVARAVAFFADPENAYVTGTVLLVDGGRSLGDKQEKSLLEDDNAA
ncbi:MAG: SDR family oxidoreductase [Alphaproteobacteria bacterium]|nr:SDR family oxidoreductase [Alphaproteobacteria bacterium]